MKKFLLVFLLLGTVWFTACEGPEGPQGPPGFDGQDGKDGERGADGLSIVDFVFDMPVDFTAENDYSAVFPVEMLSEADNYLVYLAWGVVNERVLWRPLPQTAFFEEGVLTYNFQYTSEALMVFLESNMDPATLPEEWTKNQLLRVVYMPGMFLEEDERVDLSDIEAVMSLLGKTESDVVRLPKK